jgi:DNA-binding response OmpR family regulator
MSAPSLPGRRILVVEDEMLVAMTLEAMLDEAGCRIVGPFGRLGAALKSAHADEIDAALLDVNLHGEMVFPVADALERRNIPFIFVTGYGAVGMPPRFKDRPVLTKPYKTPTLLALLVAVLSTATAPKP